MPLAVIVVLVILGLGLIWLLYNLAWGTPPSINLAVERLGLRLLLADPETFTTVGLLDNTLLDFHSGNLTDISPRTMNQLRRLDREGLALIRRYDPETLTGQKWITYHLMRWYYEQNLRGHRFDYHWVANSVFMGPYPVNHVFGVQVDLINFLSTYHKIKGNRSVRRYLQRLQMVDWKFAGLQESLQNRAADDVVPPRFVLEKSLARIEDFLSGPVSANPLYTSFMERIADSGHFSERAQTQWGERIRKAIENKVLPAYRGLQSTLEAMLENATDDDGVWRLPDGKDYYAFLLRNHTTTDLTAEEIHQLGLDEVDRLTQTIHSILEKMGLPSVDPGGQLKALMVDPQYHYAEHEQRHQKIIGDYQDILDEVNQRMPEVFSHGSLNEIVVKRLPAYKELDSPIAYAQAPALDSSRPGTMWINLRDPDNVYQWGMRTLAYHEGIPGHVYQMAHAQKIKGIPTFRRTYFFNAYVEGWALYAERLGWELKLEDSLSDLGRLQALLWRAVRLVVDTGIHSKQWTREEAIEYMVEKTGLPERDVVTEVERYIVMPGQACAYYIGYLKLLALRQKAESTLGESFNLKDFHDVVINNGTLPLSLLETVVNDYVDRAAGLKPVVPE
jgi:uncharacterized protein (DUF885 family)